jgi:hypothetical protein
MSRNIGTAVGVALFGTVFLHSVDGNLESELTAAGVPAAETARYEAAAHQFVPASGEGREASREAIVDGFVVVSAAGLGICVLAAGAAAAIRYRPVRAAPVVTPATAAPTAPAGDMPRPADA